MTGRYRRVVQLQAENGWSKAEMEDDFHHFAVTVRHDGAQVTEVQGQAVRYPWSQCPMAAGALAALRGLAISTDPTAIYRHLDPFAQCTHMLEIAGLAVTHAARGGRERRYDISVTDPVEGRSEVVLLIDEAPAGRWALRDGAIETPADQRGLRPAELRSGDLAGRPHAEAEILLILRRAVWLAASRGRDIDQYATAADVNRGQACYVFSPGRAELALRRYGSVQDFSTGPGPLPGKR